MVMAGVDGAPAPPALMVERVERRNRLTVAFRLLLALPQFIVLYLLVLVGAVAVVVGWFAALVLGRLPEPIARYLCHLTRYATRVNAYLCFLTDRYPPFEFTAADYPVQVELAPGRLNRLAVLFRLFLVIPGLDPVQPGLWWLPGGELCHLAGGPGGRPGPHFAVCCHHCRAPLQPAHDAYTWLITAAYPWGLFGDQPGPPLRAASLGPVDAPLQVVPSATTLASAPEGLEAVPGTTTLATPPPRRRRAAQAATWTAGALSRSQGIGGPVSRARRRTVCGKWCRQWHHDQQRPQDHRGHLGADSGAQHPGRPRPAIPAADRCLFCRAQLLPVGGPRAGRCLRSVRHRAASDRISRRRPSRGGGVRDLADRIASSLQDQAAAGSPEEYQQIAADNQELGNTFDQQEQTLVSSLSA